MLANTPHPHGISEDVSWRSGGWIELGGGAVGGKIEKLKVIFALVTNQILMNVKIKPVVPRVLNVLTCLVNSIVFANLAFP